VLVVVLDRSPEVSASVNDDVDDDDDDDDDVDDDDDDDNNNEDIFMCSEESDQLVATVRQQYEQQVTQLQRDLEEARRGSGASPATTEQLQQEKDRLAAENAELQNKVGLI
jgi:hypothetical protein